MYILFSAPRKFIEDIHFDSSKQENYKIDFIEIWKFEELNIDLSEYDCWIPNPGQNFIINKKVLNKFKRLSIISTPSTGTNHIDLEICKKKGIKVFGLLDQPNGLERISASAEFTFLKMLAQIRNLRLAWSEINHDRWRENEDDLRGREIDEMHFGFIGLGRIGKKLTKFLSPFSPKSMTFYDPFIKEKPENVSRASNMIDIFKYSDLIVLCLGLNDQTKNLIDKNLLSVMKQDSILINTSRGEIINEIDLIAFLNKRKDVSFSADVIVGEVTDEHLSNPLVDLHKTGRINLTPHIAGATIGSQTKAALLALKAIFNNE